MGMILLGEVKHRKSGSNSVNDYNLTELLVNDMAVKN